MLLAILLMAIGAGIGWLIAAGIKNTMPNWTDSTGKRIGIAALVWIGVLFAETSILGYEGGPALISTFAALGLYWFTKPDKKESDA